MGTSPYPVSDEQPGMVLDHLDKAGGVWAPTESHDVREVKKFKSSPNKMVPDVD